jgi:hypothetical protein
VGVNSLKIKNGAVTLLIVKKSGQSSITIDQRLTGLIAGLAASWHNFN